MFTSLVTNWFFIVFVNLNTKGIINGFEITNLNTTKLIIG